MKEKCCWFIIIYSYKLIKIYSYKLIKSLMQNENASIFFFFKSPAEGSVPDWFWWGGKTCAGNLLQKRNYIHTVTSWYRPDWMIGWLGGGSKPLHKNDDAGMSCPSRSIRRTCILPTPLDTPSLLSKHKTEIVTYVLLRDVFLILECVHTMSKTWWKRVSIY